MSIQAFTFPLPETRFFLAGQQVFKFKIRRGEMGSIYAEGVLDAVIVTEELENAVRAVLANLDSLQPFATQHFNIFPYKSEWEQVSKFRFMKEGVRLHPYPFLITLYVEYRAPVFHYKGSNTSVWNNSETFPASKDPEASQADHNIETDCPEEGTVDQDEENYVSADHFEHFGESPSLANGAETMVCGSEIHVGSDGLCLPRADANGCKIEQSPSECHDANSDMRQNSGILARLASSLFPFSIFSSKTTG